MSIIPCNTPSPKSPGDPMAAVDEMIQASLAKLLNRTRPGHAPMCHGADDHDGPHDCSTDPIDLPGGNGHRAVWASMHHDGAIRYVLSEFDSGSSGSTYLTEEETDQLIHALIGLKRRIACANIEAMITAQFAVPLVPAPRGGETR